MEQRVPVSRTSATAERSGHTSHTDSQLGSKDAEVVTKAQQWGSDAGPPASTLTLH